MRKCIVIALCAIAAGCGQGRVSHLLGNDKEPRPADASRALANELVRPETHFIDHALLGSELGADGSVSKSRDRFTPGQPIYLTMVLRESPAGLQTSAVWTDADKKQLRVERKEMKGTKVATFSLGDPKLKPGHYRVTGYWGGNIATEQEFDVVAQEKAKGKEE